MKDNIKRLFNEIPNDSLELDFKPKIKNITKLEGGFSNSNYIIDIYVKKFILRLNLYPEKHPNKCELEFNILKTLEQSNLTPKAYYFQRVKNSPLHTDFLILQYINGIALQNSKQFLQKKIFYDLGKLIADFHRVSQDLGSSKSNTLLKNQHQDVLDQISTHFIAEIESNKVSKLLLNFLKDTHMNIKNRTTIKYQPNVVFGHGDLWSGNIIDSNGKLFLIDLEDCGPIDQAKEIANLFYDFGRIVFDDEKNMFYQTYLIEEKGELEILKKRVESWKDIILFKVLVSFIRHFTRLRLSNSENTVKEKDFRFFKFLISYCQKENLFNPKYEIKLISKEITSILN